jgi:ribose transport system substrate-binding protein
MTSLAFAKSFAKEAKTAARTTKGGVAMLAKRSSSRWQPGLTAVGIAIAVMLSFGASFAPPAEAANASKGKKVLYLETFSAVAYVAAVVRAFRQRAESYGMEVTTLASGPDAALQARQVDNAIASKFDMLAIQALSEQGIVPSLVRAKKAGLPVILSNNPIKEGSENLYLSFVGQDQVEMGRIAGKSILDALKKSGRDGGKVALITGALQQGIGPRRLAGIREVLKANPKVKIVAVEDAHWATAPAERIAGQLYARFAASGGLDVVYGMADNMSVAAIKAAQAAGISVGTGPKQMIVVGGNCLKQGLDAIRAGLQYSTILQSPTDVGKTAADKINDYFNGKTLPKNVLLPIVPITKANVDKWVAPCTF